MKKRAAHKSSVMKIALIAMMAVSMHSICAQSKYIDRRGHASFFSSAPMEDIKAENDQAVSIIDTQTGEIVASMLMRSFNFRKALMEEHFNENYVESDKYPKATFRGKIVNLAYVDFAKEGNYTLDIAGEINLHGVTQPLTLKAEVVVRGGTVHAKAVFPLRVKDFKIEVPRLVINNIAEVVEVTVSFNYQPMNP
jgi:polyisoprenoid-binding protein YceI